jgi:hypothetical protein
MTRKDLIKKMEEIDWKYLAIAKKEKNDFVRNVLDLLKTPDVGDVVEVGEDSIVVDEKEKHWNFYNYACWIRCRGFVIKKGTKDTLTEKRTYVDYDLED